MKEESPEKKHRRPAIPIEPRITRARSQKNKENQKAKGKSKKAKTASKK